nr:probable peroxidase 61 [Malus domestica]
MLLLQEFDIEIKDKKGSDNVVVADHLSRLVREEEDLPISETFPDEQLLSVQVHIQWAEYIVATFHDQLYNFNGTKKPDPSMDPSLLYDLRKSCLLRTKKGQTNPLNSLYKAMLGIDHYCTREITEEFAAGLEDFRRSFAMSMNQMGAYQVLIGNQGEIRKNCRIPNKK